MDNFIIYSIIGCFILYVIVNTLWFSNYIKLDKKEKECLGNLLHSTLVQLDSLEKLHPEMKYFIIVNKAKYQSIKEKL